VRAVFYCVGCADESGYRWKFLGLPYEEVKLLPAKM